MRKYFILFTFLLAAVSGCTSVTDKLEASANKSFTSYALGKPYQDIANLGNSPLEQLSGKGPTYGPMIGATKLANGMMVYRHIAPAATTETGSDFAGLVGTSTVSVRNRLSYFLVGPDSIVKDWATGSVQGSAQDCVNYIGGILNKCSDIRALEASMALYDTMVMTKDGQPISVWNTAM